MWTWRIELKLFYTYVWETYPLVLDILWQNVAHRWSFFFSLPSSKKRKKEKKKGCTSQLINLTENTYGAKWAKISNLKSGKLSGYEVLFWPQKKSTTNEFFEKKEKKPQLISLYHKIELIGKVRTHVLWLLVLSCFTLLSSVYASTHGGPSCSAQEESMDMFTFCFCNNKTVQTAYQLCFWNGDVVVNLHVW